MASVNGTQTTFNVRTGNAAPVRSTALFRVLKYVIRGEVSFWKVVFT
jgi:hypothetical protein